MRVPHYAPLGEALLADGYELPTARPPTWNPTGRLSPARATASWRWRTKRHA